MADPTAASDPLTSLAEAVADGTPVDWARAEREVDAPVLRQLRALEQLSLVLRSPVPEPLARWGALEVRQRLGAGTFGAVYEAFDPRLERAVALKIFHGVRGSVEAALQEGRALARCRHPNLVAVHSIEANGGSVGICMELIRGRTLAQLIQSDGPLGAREAAAIGADVCRALAEVHRAGLVHRDVKAQNVMREDGGRIVLMDLGAVWAAGGRGEALGTPMYAAPEQLAGGPASPAADVYSVGVLLYHLVTGAFPVTGATLEEIRAAHQAGRRSRLLDVRPDLPAPFVVAVERALAPAAERFRTAGELAAALAAPGPRALPRRAIAGGLVGLLAITVGAAWLLRPAAPFELQASLFREDDFGARPLRSGDPVAPGDRLFLEVSAARPTWLYVLNEDARGEAFLLFPLPEASAHNPVPPGTRRIPETLSWQVTSRGGSEQLLLVAAPQPIPELEEELAAWPRAEEGRAMPALLRGIGGLTSAPTPPPGSRLAELSRQLEGLWIRRIVLSNSER